MQKSTRRRAIWFATIFAATSLLVSCRNEETPKGLVLGLQMDLVVPEDTDHVAVYVALLRDGRRINQPPAEVKKVSEATFSFVASLVLESYDPNDRVQVRFVAYDAAGKVRAMREARASVPSQGTRLLRLPLLWINDGLVTSSDGPLTAASSVDLANVSLRDATDDVFTKLSDGCPADQSRGNDGLCHDIEVKLDELMDLGGGVAAPIPACMDLATCFEGAHVETFDLGARSGCELPIRRTASTDKPALVLVGPNTGGFPLPSGQRGRPIDDALYGYDVQRSVLLLGPALCAKIERDAITTAIVSAKCAPKETDTPVCNATKQASGDPRPTNAGIFVDEGAPEGGPPDAGPDDGGDGGDVPIPPTIGAVATIPEQEILSFTARGGADGMLWIAGSYDDDGRIQVAVRVAPWITPAAPTSIELEPDDDIRDRGKLVETRTGETFFVQNQAGSEYGAHHSLGSGVPGEVGKRVRLCAAGGCTADADACSEPPVIAVGDQDDESVLLVASEDQAAWRVKVDAAVRRGPTLGCFEPRTSNGLPHAFETPVGYRLTGLYPAVTVEGTLAASLSTYSSSNPDPDALVRSTKNALTVDNRPPLDRFEYLASIGEGRALTTSWIEGDESSRTNVALFEPNFTFVQQPVQTVVEIRTIDEMFGVPNVACMRGRDEQDRIRIACVLRSPTGELQSTVLRLSANVYDVDDSNSFREFDPHVYSDERYLYVGQHCPGAPRTFEVRGVAWQNLQEREALEAAFVGLCGGDIEVQVE